MAKKDIQLDRPMWTTKKKEWGEMGKNEANENMMNKGFRNEKCKIEETGSDRFLLPYRCFYSSIAFVI